MLEVYTAANPRGAQMVLFLVAFAIAGLNSATPAEPLTSRVLPTSLFVIPDRPSLNFDLYDMRAAATEPASHSEVQPHTIFSIKRHIGLAAGYDNGVVHGSLGMYLTVAQVGRWNFGVTSPEIGFGRYREFDERTKQAFMKTESSILISLASVHYRGGRIRS